MNKLWFFVFSIICLILTFNPNLYTFSSSVFWTSFIIQILSIYNIFKNSNVSYSLDKIFYLFTLFFFGISPLLQFEEGLILWGSRRILESEYVYMNLLVIGIMLLYQILYSTFYKFAKIRKIEKNINNSTVQRLYSKQAILLIFLSLASFILVLYSNNFSLLSILFRGGEFKTAASDSQPINLIIGNFVRPIPMICFLFYLQSSRKNKVALFILLIMTLLTCSPTGMSRSTVAALYIPFLILVFPIFQKKNVFTFSFLFGLLVFFPFLNVFRSFSKTSDISLKLDTEMFLSGHFDSFYNFTLIVCDNIVTYGWQLLGVLFFWVPRSLWIEKPIGSGALLANDSELTFNNISANYFAEGYINFGFIGIAIFIFLLAYFNARMDRYYWRRFSNSQNGEFKILYCAILGFLFFLLRGDLLSSTAYTFGFVFAFLFVRKIIKSSLPSIKYVS